MTIREFWLRITSTRYTRALEDEVLLLRAENRALLNSILGIAGVPPILTAPNELPGGERWSQQAIVPVGGGAGESARRASREGRDVRPSSTVSAGNGAGSKLSVPMRRRSWQQINRMLEFESGLKKRES